MMLKSIIYFLVWLFYYTAGFIQGYIEGARDGDKKRKEESK